MTSASEAELDDLYETYLVLLNKHQLQREELSSNLSSGFFSIAKANFTAPSFVRYGQDHYDDRMRAIWRTNISARSIETGASDAVSVVHVQQRVRTSSEDLAQLAPTPSDDGVTAVENSNSSHEDRANDPLRWFGILVPPPLRAAQKSFAQVVCDLIPGLVNLDLEMKTLEKQIALHKDRSTRENGSVASQFARSDNNIYLHWFNQLALHVQYQWIVWPGDITVSIVRSLGFSDKSLKLQTFRLPIFSSLQISKFVVSSLGPSIVAIMSDGQIFKPDKDYTKEADKVIPEAQELAKSNVEGAIEKLSAFEKQTRQASDLASTSRVLVAIVTICKDAGQWDLLSEQILLLSKKHGQLKQATTKMVQVAMSFLDGTPSVEKKLSVIETLRTVTEGKIFVEVERARVTKILSDIKRSQGDLKGAAEILCELQVETFGSMERREKTEFILEQVSLCILNDDWTQASILSRKIGTKYFARKPKLTPEQVEKAKKEREEMEKKRSVDDPPLPKEDDVTDLKLRFYEQQITLAKHDDKYLDACKNYRQILDTDAVEENPELLQSTLRNVMYFIMLSPYDNEQSDLLQRIYRDARNSESPLDARLLKLFTIHELMRWPLVSEQFGPHLCKSETFTGEEAGSPESKKAYQRWQDLRKRVIEHNVRVVAKYYTRIEIGRLTQLLDLDEDETEKYISQLVTAKTVYAKIDRPARIVNFAKPRDADDVLNEWSGSMKSLLGLLERIDHLITKEEMMARLQPAGEEPKRAKRANKAR